MHTNSHSLARLTNLQLIVEVKALAASEREATAKLIASLAELDKRRLYLGEGFSSMFTYCTQCLQLSEHAAYNRIEAARAARKWEVILELLEGGSLTLSTVCVLAPHLTTDNHRALLGAAQHKSKREVEHLVAALHPQPDVGAAVRKLPLPKVPDLPIQVTKAAAPAESIESDVDRVATLIAAGQPATGIMPGPRAPSRPPVVAPLSPERYKVQFTIGRQTHDKLRRAQDMLRHALPSGDPAEIFDRALTLLVEQLERRRVGRATRPRGPRAGAPDSRHIPSAVKRTVWERDGGRCAFVGTEGQCGERGWLEYHHVVPYASSGAATVENIQLRCRAHNQYEAEAIFGPRDLFVRERPLDVTSVPLLG
jgi:5-methylcytosine-specific restriction endonuclease McrA